MTALSAEQIEAVAMLRARGVALSDIAVVIGVTSDALEQHLQDPVLAKVTSTHASNERLKELRTDDKWDQVESAALDGVLKDLKGNSAMFDPNALVNLARIANNAKRRHGQGRGAAGSTSAEAPGVLAGKAGHVTVNISLPGALMHHLRERVIDHNEGRTREAVSLDKFEQFAKERMAVPQVEELLGVDLNKIMPGGASYGGFSDELLSTMNNTPESAHTFDPSEWGDTGTVGERR